MLITFNNPYSFKYANSELALLLQNQENITFHIKNFIQVFYGVGVGETELELVRWQLEASNYCDVIGIDIIQAFLELFYENMKFKQIEFPEASISLKLLASRFQDITPDDLTLSQTSSKSKSKVHICIGGTVGNFSNQSEMWNIISNNMARGDRLLLGAQLKTHIKKSFDKYKDSKYFPSFVLNYKSEINPNNIEWKLKENLGLITMEYDGIEAFRSKRYEIEELRDAVEKRNLRLRNIYVDKYNNTCILIAEK